MRMEGYEHTRETKNKISTIMKEVAAKRKAATANERFYRVTTSQPNSKYVHIMREGLRYTLCRGLKHPTQITENPVNCPRCLAHLPSGAWV